MAKCSGCGMDWNPSAMARRKLVGLETRCSRCYHNAASAARMRTMRGKFPPEREPRPRKLAPWLVERPELYRGERVPEPVGVHPDRWDCGPPVAIQFGYEVREVAR